MGICCCLLDLQDNLVHAFTRRDDYLLAILRWPNVECRRVLRPI
jgi:hypothetical protein